jgi:hypothetical protein
VVLLRVLKFQALDLNGLQLVHRRRVVQDVLEVHKDLAIRLARAAGIVTRLARVRITRADNNPAMQLARVVDTATRPAHVRLSRRDNNRSRRRGLSQRGAGVAALSPLGDKAIRASAIALKGEGDLGSSKNAQYETRASGGLLTPQGSRMYDYIAFIIVAVCVVIGAGLFRIGLHLKSESRAEGARRARQFIALGIAFGFAAILILALAAMKLSPATWQY